MNICFVITTLSGGGAERVASILCTEWAKMGNNVNLILTSKSNNQNPYYINGTKVHSLSPNKKIPIFKKIKLVRKILIETNAEIVVTFFPNSSFIAQRAMRGLKVLSVVSERNDPKHKKGFSQKLLRKITFKKADGIVFQTNSVKEMFGGQIRNKSIVISNPLSPILYKYSPSNSGLKRIVAVGRLVKQKRYPYLVEAFRYFNTKNPNYVLDIYGSGPDETLIKKLINKYNLSNKVKLYPYTSNVLDRINESAFFVMPSLFEGFPNALMEAVILQKPCVVSDFMSGSAQYLVDNNVSGILVDTSASPKEFADKMTVLVDNIDSFKNGAKAKSKAIFDNNNAEVIAAKWIDFFKGKING